MVSVAGGGETTVGPGLEEVRFLLGGLEGSSESSQESFPRPWLTPASKSSDLILPMPGQGTIADALTFTL